MNFKTVMMPSPELILFDAVGTLIEPDPPVLVTYQRVGLAYGDDRSIAELSARWRAALSNGQLARQWELPGQTSEAAEVDFWRAIVGEVLWGVPAPHKETAFQALWDHFAQPTHWRLFDDVPETLSQLRERGYRLGIASNFDARLIKIVAAYPPLNSCTDIFISSQVGWRKPADGFYAAVQRATQIAPQHILLVGDDRDCDYAAPLRQGWQARYLVRKAATTAGDQIVSLKDLLPLLP